MFQLHLQLGRLEVSVAGFLDRVVVDSDVEAGAIQADFNLVRDRAMFQLHLQLGRLEVSVAGFLDRVVR